MSMDIMLKFTASAQARNHELEETHVSMMAGMLFKDCVLR